MMFGFICTFQGELSKITTSTCISILCPITINDNELTFKILSFEVIPMVGDDFSAVFLQRLGPNIFSCLVESDAVGHRDGRYEKTLATRS